MIITLVTLFGAVSMATASFGAREPLPQSLLDAQTVCVKYLGICESRLEQYNNSVYPGDRDTMRVVRCAGIILGFWDDSKGLLLDGFVAFYPKLADDISTQRRILSCAERRLAACMPEDTCAKAFNAFHCFLEARRNDLTGREPTQQPGDPTTTFNGADFINSLMVCAKILRVPANMIELYRQGVFPNDDQTQCVIRCVGIRTELYDDERGPNLARLYGQFGGGQSEADFRRRATICMNANQYLASAQNKCAQAYRKLYLCFKDAFSALTRANANAMF
ncbi:AGAP002190-PA-like protein [Anopheles sinensis]|uniref:AGAP002190-PA-like protein n=1 Tax=Anopheles sinensis TaxID=74873 RepID=A0A084VVT1_ANOSI|nr:AGAP002190-PA-like protein [Anopheles sinensis]